MNLNQIVARIGELSAELLTLHNDLTFLVEGTVSRTHLVHSVTVDWKDLKEGDLIHVQTGFKTHGSQFAAPGIYTVEDVEDEDYDGDLPFSITGNGLDGEWVYCEDPSESSNNDYNDYHERGNTGTNAYGLFRKVS